MRDSVAEEPMPAGSGVEPVRRAVSDACRRAGRDPASVSLIAVSKTVRPPALEAAITAGHRVFGENRVQEARTKWPPLRADQPDLELHLLGPLQSNKAREAVGLFDVIHSVDRLGLCKPLAAHSSRIGHCPKLFVQVNTGAEPQKSGVLPDQVDAFVKACRETYELDVAGLMCVPPVHEPPAGHFALLSGLAERNGLGSLSMGMSNDFELAIEHGATHVRVGSAIFGRRPPPAQPVPEPDR